MSLKSLNWPLVFQATKFGGISTIETFFFFFYFCFVALDLQGLVISSLQEENLKKKQKKTNQVGLDLSEARVKVSLEDTELSCPAGLSQTVSWLPPSLWLCKRDCLLKATACAAHPTSSSAGGSPLSADAGRDMETASGAVAARQLSNCPRWSRLSLAVWLWSDQPSFLFWNGEMRPTIANTTMWDYQEEIVKRLTCHLNRLVDNSVRCLCCFWIKLKFQELLKTLNI